MASPDRRNELRARMLVVLNSTSEPINYHDTVPGVDAFELREAASWLVESGYAVWSGGGVVVTDAGRELVSSLDSLERRQADT